MIHDRRSPAPPRRRHSLTVNIHGDDVETLQRALAEISAALTERGTQSVTGGASWGGHWEQMVNESQPAEQYKYELDRWLEESNR